MRRQPFFFNLGALGAAFLLIVAAIAFGPGAVKGVGLGIGVFSIVVSLWFVGWLAHSRRFGTGRELRLLGRRMSPGSLLAGAITSVAIWETVSAAVFQPGVSRWLTLANGLLIAVLGCAGLVMHEITTERVVHVLEVFDRSDREL